MHVCKTDWLALPASGRKHVYLHALECVCVCVILCKSEANKVVESARRRETKMWNKCNREAGTGGILETSNSFLSPHTLLETSSICRYTERHEQQQGGRSCLISHVFSISTPHYLHHHHPNHHIMVHSSAPGKFALMSWEVVFMMAGAFK